MPLGLMLKSMSYHEFIEWAAWFSAKDKPPLPADDQDLMQRVKSMTMFSGKKPKRQVPR